MLKRKVMAVLLLTLLVSLFTATAALADHGGDPVGACPPAFELHHMMMGDGEHEHEHIGANTDANMDHYLCVKHLPNNLHLHIDNYLPLP